MSSTARTAIPTQSRFTALQSQIWSGSIPLSITLAPSDCRTYTDSEPYLIQFPRLSYLAFLLPRLHAFFVPKLIDPTIPAHDAWLEFQGVPLKWHFPVGLLFDLYAGIEPAEGLTHEPVVNDLPTDRSTPDSIWRLKVHYTDFPIEHLIPLDEEGKMIRDWYVNGVKEADFVRNGSARPVMGLSREDSDKLWESVRGHDLEGFNGVNHKLLYAPGVEMRHVPLKIYLPSVSSADPAAMATEAIAEEGNDGTTSAGHFRVVQALALLLQADTRVPQTLGTALHKILPTVFPSRRNPLLAQPVLHGAVVPMGANLEELGRAAAYTDGFLHIVVSMFG